MSNLGWLFANLFYADLSKKCTNHSEDLLSIPTDPPNLEGDDRNYDRRGVDI